MQTDELSQTIIAYVSQHPRPQQALLPEEMSQGILDLLVEDTRHMAADAIEKEPRAGRYITLALLLLRSHTFKTKKIDITEEELRRSLSRYTQAIYLESMKRQGLIKEIHPELNTAYIFEGKEKLSFQLTELGKRVSKETMNPLPNYL